nr:DUF2523 family protein [Pseudomonas sp. TCU-HL1]
MICGISLLISHAGVLESVLGLASSALSTIDVPFNPQTYYGMLPPDVVNMLGVIGLTQALTMIVAALVVVSCCKLSRSFAGGPDHD